MQLFTLIMLIFLSVCFLYYLFADLYLVYQVTTRLPKVWAPPTTEEILDANRLIDEYTGIQDDSALNNTFGNNMANIGNVEEWNNCLFPKKRSSKSQTCTEMCGLNNPDQYSYKVIKVPSGTLGGVIFKGKKLEGGEYCYAYPKEKTRADPNSVGCSIYGLLVYNGEKWVCLSQMPMLIDGPEVDTIVWGAHPSVADNTKNGLYDKKNKKFWRPELENANFPDINNFDQWETRCEGQTEDGFNLFPYSHMCFVDWCSDIPYSGNKIDPKTLECQCLQGFTNENPKDRHSKCIPEGTTTDSRGFVNLPVGKCWTLDTPVKDITYHMIPCDGVKESYMEVEQPILIDLPFPKGLTPSVNDVRSYVPISKWNNGM